MDEVKKRPGAVPFLKQGPFAAPSKIPHYGVERWYSRIAASRLFLGAATPTFPYLYSTRDDGPGQDKGLSALAGEM